MGKYRTPSNFSGIKVEVGVRKEASFSSLSIGRQVLLHREGFIFFFREVDIGGVEIVLTVSGTGKVGVGVTVVVVSNGDKGAVTTSS